MTEHQLIGLASIIILGIVAQWLAWRLHLPAILLLLVFGIAAGSIAGVLNPDELFGELLFPFVSISVSIILFEGGLSLKLGELRRGGAVIRNLVTVGIFVTWILAATLAHLVAGVELALAVLLGAVLVVSGPTVIVPLLRQVRPKSDLASIIKWEGIVNDPIGAILAVLVFEVILAGGMQQGTSMVIWGVIKAFVFGSLTGLLGAGVIVLLLKRYLIPDFLQNPFSLMLVVVCYVASNALQMESGLLAVTVMGIALANQKYVSIKHITEFKENLRVLLISSLFIILAARLPSGQFTFTNVTDWIFVALLILVVRPVAVFASTWQSSLKFREKLFLSWMAPRGIVAAAVVSVFAIRLSEAGFAGSEKLVPLTFQVIIGTVAIYGLSASKAARILKVAQPNPQGVLFAGAHSWVREMAAILRDEGFQVATVDSNWENIVQARSDGCRTKYGSIIAEDLLYDLQLEGIGRLMAMTPNSEVNSLASLHFVDIFGRREVYQLPPPASTQKSRQSEMPLHLRGRYLFDETATFDDIEGRMRSGAVVKKNSMTDEFDFGAFMDKYGKTAIPLFVITESHQLKVFTTDSQPSVDPGCKLISIVDPVDDQ